MADKNNKNNDKEEIVIKKSTIITVAAVLAVILVLILSWGNIEKLIKSAGSLSKSIKSSDVVAEVNGEQITLDDLDQAYDFFFFITGYPPEFKQFLTKEAYLDQLINEKILLQEVDKQGIELSDSEFDELKENIFINNNVSESEIKDLLAENNITYDYFIAYYKKQVLITKLLNKTTIDDIDVSEEEIKDYYEQNEADFAGQTLEDSEENIRIMLISVKQREVLTKYIDGLKSEADIKISYNGEGIASVSGAATQVKNECIQKYGLTDKTVIFYHASWCPHCKNMVPIIEDLEEEGYSFIWVEVDDKESMAIIDDCFSDVVGQGVPEFICAGSKEVKMGEISKSALKKFAESCN